MGSTGEPERKRRHFSSISSAVSTPAKNSPLSPRSEDKKIDAAVLQYRNQKLAQQLEAQKVEYLALENKLDQLKERQRYYDNTIDVVNRSWEWLVSDLDSLSIQVKGTSNDQASFLSENDFLCRLVESGANMCCSIDKSTTQVDEDKKITRLTTENILQNIASAVIDLWHLKNMLSSACATSLAEIEPARKLQGMIYDSQTKIKGLHVAIGDLHLRHRPLSNDLQIQRDIRAKNMAELKRLTGELDSTNKDLEDVKNKMSKLKTQSDARQGAPYLFPTLGNSQVFGEKARDKENELQDLESANKELMALASNRLLGIRRLHDKKLETLKRVSHLQNILSDLHNASASTSYNLLSEKIEKLKSDLDQSRSFLDELQVERDVVSWKEKEVLVMVDLADLSRRASTIAQNRISDLEKLIQEQINEKIVLASRLDDSLREPGRKDIITEFKALVASLPLGMETMQNQMSKYKEDSSGIHSLRAKVKYLTDILGRKKVELDELSIRLTDQVCDIDKLQAAMHDLKNSNQELKLFLEMYKHESAYSRDVMECQDSEFKAWSSVKILQAALDEHSLEMRVKEANEAEAISQQKLATAEAQIADLRQRLDAAERETIKLSEVLKSKHEEGESYLSEIESIGQAYDDVQNKNQHLLQQITERDDYNIKLVLEIMKGRQEHDVLRMEIEAISWEVQQANASLDVYSKKFSKLDDQSRIWSEQVDKLAEDGWQCSVALENTKRRLLDVQRESQQLRRSLGEMRPKVDNTKLKVSELQIELEKEKFNKKRVEEDLEVVTRKAARLRAHTEGLSVLGKLQQELREYKGILKCGNCHDRQKEVVIAKCYHLFCSFCIKKTIESRQRKCPTCFMSFGPNDVKSIYI